MSEHTKEKDHTIGLMAMATIIAVIAIMYILLK